MARVEYMSEAQKPIIHALWEAGKTQNKIAVLLGSYKSVISKITRQTCSKRSNCSSKLRQLLKLNVSAESDPYFPSIC